MRRIRRPCFAAESGCCPSEQVDQLLIGIVGPVLGPVLQIDVPSARRKLKHGRAAPLRTLNHADGPDATAGIPERAKDREIGDVGRFLARYVAHLLGCVVGLLAKSAAASMAFAATSAVACFSLLSFLGGTTSDF